MSGDVLTIAPTSGDTARKPGETLELTASWSLATAPSSVVVRLLWFASGFEVSEGAVVASQTLPEAVRGEYPVTFTLPKAPYSFIGKLVQLRWAVELIAGTASPASWEFDLSPTGEAIVLANAPPAELRNLAPDPVFASMDHNPGYGDAIAAALQIGQRTVAGPGGSRILAKGIASVAAVIAFFLVSVYFVLRPSAPSPVRPPVVQVQHAIVVPAGAPAVRRVPPAVPIVLPDASEWVVTEQAFGPLLFDRSVEATEAALGIHFELQKDSHGCSAAELRAAPQGAQPIVDGNMIVGVTIQGGAVETSQHVKIGTLETAVRTAYSSHGESLRGTRAESGYYEMIITPRPGPPTYQIIFGIVDGRVLSYRAGNAEEMNHRQHC